MKLGLGLQNAAVMRPECRVDLFLMQTSGDEPVYVISVAARLAGLPCWVLRVLDQEGVVVPVRTDSNRRLYSDNDISWLTRVRYLTEERGVNIAGVKVILEIERERGAVTSPVNGHAAPVSLSAAEYTTVRDEGSAHDLPVRRQD